MSGVSITYVGVPVCADAQVAESDAGGARIATREPMPVGSEVEVTIDGAARRARVTSVSEVRDAGMRLAFVDAGPAPVEQRETVGPAIEARADAPAVVPAEPVEPRPKRRKKKSE